MATKLIFLVWGTNIYSTYWVIESAHECEVEANKEAEKLRLEETDKRFKVMQIPLVLKHK